MGLVEGYDAMKLTLAQPKLRADLEKDLKLICSGQRNPKDVLHEQIEIYKKAYRVITQEVRSLDQSLAARYDVFFLLFLTLLFFFICSLLCHNIFKVFIDLALLFLLKTMTQIYVIQQIC